jgi:hypothetical protein
MWEPPSLFSAAAPSVGESERRFASEFSPERNTLFWWIVYIFLMKL